MKTSIVYKVVEAAEDGKLYSAIIAGKLATEYNLNVKVKAKVGKLFCFSTLDYAKLFAYGSVFNTIYKILRCKTTCALEMYGKDELNIPDPSAMFDEDMTNIAKDYWHSVERGEELTGDYCYRWAPAGTVLVKSLTPLEVINL